jgi:hypothetical protein
MADKHGVSHKNIVLTGDGNTKLGAWYVKSRGWTEAIYSAVKKIDLQWHSTNGWRPRLTLGRRIDLDISHRLNPLRLAEQLTVLIADHWAHRAIRRLVRK